MKQFHINVYYFEGVGENEFLLRRVRDILRRKEGVCNESHSEVIDHHLKPRTLDILSWHNKQDEFIQLQHVPGMTYCVWGRTKAPQKEDFTRFLEEMKSFCPGIYDAYTAIDPVASESGVMTCYESLENALANEAHAFMELAESYFSSNADEARSASN